MIDAHQHFWHPARGEYAWMDPGDAVLARHYGPIDLAPLMAAAGVGRSVLVQAAPSLAETDYLLGIADATPDVAAVVGWFDFEIADHRRHLDRWAQHPKFAGVRPMIQDIADPDWMLDDAVQWGFAATADAGLTFDALGHPRHLPNFATLMRRHPDLKLVIDHAMKPDIDTGTGRAAWADGIAALADLGAWCKLSGLLTEAAPGAGDADLAPWVDHLLRCFGSNRLIWGSDWPVLNLAADYAQWHAMARRLTAELGEAGQARVFGANAVEFYRLPA